MVALGDRALVAAMVHADPRGLDGAYRCYAGPLHAYCRSLLRDAEMAADVVHDVFVIASQRAAQLRDPDRLRSWLYAIARNECVRQLRSRLLYQPLDEPDEVGAEPEDLGASVHTAQLRQLIEAAMEGLSSSDREVLELTLRHGLSAADLAAVLGLSADHAHARLSRARTQLESALGVLLVARESPGVDRCTALNELLRGWDGRLTALLRKRVGRHVRTCARCEQRRRERLSPASLLGVGSVLPMPAIPEALDGRMRPTSAESPLRASVSGRPGRRRPAVVGMAATFALLLGVIVVVSMLEIVVPPQPRLLADPWAPVGSVGSPHSSSNGLNGSPGSNGSPDATPATAGPDPVPARSAPGPGTRGPGTPPAGGSPTQGRSPRVPATTGSLELTARGGAVCDAAPSYSLTVSAAGHGTRLSTAYLHWRETSTTADHRQAMTIDGSTARTTVGRLQLRSVTWWVSVTAADGRAADGQSSNLLSPCR